MTKYTIIFPLIVLFGISACAGKTASESTATSTQSIAPSATLLPSPTITPEPTKSVDVSFIEKTDPAHIRVVNYNINWDAIFPVGDPDSHGFREFAKGKAFERVIAALQPDILCLQEINPSRDASEISDILNSIFGLSDEDGWQAMIVRDNVIASRFPLLTEGWQIETNTVRPDFSQAAALIDLPDGQFALDFYMICSHFKASGSPADIRQRQQQADVLMSNVRDIRTIGDHMDLPFGSPFVLLGDFNVYTSDPAEHLTTMITGDIEDNDRYGPDFQPDWDESALGDVLPTHNGMGIDSYTWRDDQFFYPKGILDHILFSDSVLSIENSFVLNTTLIAEETLAILGLQEFDVVLIPMTGYFDHLPLVVDFSIIDIGEQ